MVTLKGGAVTLPEGTVAIAGCQGSGKSPTILSHIAPFGQINALGFLTDQPWRPVPGGDKFRQVGALVGGIPACIVRAPIASAADDVAAGIREALAAQVAR